MSNTPPPPPPPSNHPPPPPPPSPPPPGYGSVPPAYGAMPTMVGDRNYAGWWRRVGAAIVDGLIAVVFYVPAIIVLIVGPTERGTCSDLNGFDRPCDVPTNATLGLGVLLYVVGFLAFLVIYVRMLGKGATWGRKALGYRVLDECTMQPIGTGRAVGRYFATILSALPCYLGFLWPLWDSENRTFHDMLVNSRAVMN